MKTNRNVSILLENGFHFSTISKMKPNEVKLLAEKFFKPMGDVGQAKKDSMKAMKAFIKNNKVDLGLGDDSDDFSDEQILDKIKGLAYWAKSPNGSKLNKMAGELYRIAKPLFKGKSKETNEAELLINPEDPKDVELAKQKKLMTPDGKIITPLEEAGDAESMMKYDAGLDPDQDIPTESEIKEKFESKAQQGFFWAKCNTSKGVKKKKWCEMAREFSDSTSKKQYKDMPEKKRTEKTVKRKTRKNTDENYEKYLEEQIFNMIEKHIEPSMTKGELLRTIQEKVDKSEKFMLSNPKKNTMFQKETKESMMKKPIGKMFSMGKELDEDTKEKERTKEREKTKTPTRRENPFKDPNPGVEEQPKANTREKERTKEREKTKTPTRRKGNPFKDPNPGVEEQPKAEDQKNDFMVAITSILRK